MICVSMLGPMVGMFLVSVTAILGDASNDYGETAPKYGGCDHDNGDQYHKSGDRAHARFDSIDVMACMPRKFILVAGVFAW